MKLNLTIQPVPEDRHQEFIDFFYRDFFPREPLALASGLAGKTNPKTKDTFTEWLRQGVSLTVIDPESNEIVAGSMNCILKKSEVLFDPDYSCMEREDRVIWKFLDHLDTAYDPFKELQVDTGMELVLLCVRDSHTGQGLARRLAEETIATAARLGFSFIKSNPSTPVTCHLFKSLGFETMNEMKLVDFRLDGEVGFPNAKSEDIARLCIKKIGK